VDSSIGQNIPMREEWHAIRLSLSILQQNHRLFSFNEQKYDSDSKKQCSLSI